MHLVGRRIRSADPEPPLQDLAQCALAPANLECLKSADCSPSLVRVCPVEQELGPQDDRSEVNPARIEKRRVRVGLVFDGVADRGSRGSDICKCSADNGGGGMRAPEELNNEPVHHMGRDALSLDLRNGGGRRCW
jgi:hypothetical protein